MKDDELLEDLSRAAPELRAASWRPLGEGWMSRVLLVDERWVARFAKSESASEDLQKEARILPLVAARASLSVPRFELVGQQRSGLSFVVYPLVPGEPLPETLGPLAPQTRERVAAQIAGFIAELRSLSVVELAAAGLTTAGRHANVGETREAWQRLESELPRDVFRHAQRRFDEYLDEPRYQSADVSFLHADLSPNHWLLDAERAELSGIIDFGDCELGDPDYEHLYLLQDAGEAFTRRVMELLGATDIEARLQKLRYLVTFDHARGVLASKRHDQAEHGAECVAALREEAEAKGPFE